MTSVGASETHSINRYINKTKQFIRSFGVYQHRISWSRERALVYGCTLCTEWTGASLSSSATVKIFICFGKL